MTKGCRISLMSLLLLWLGVLVGHAQGVAYYEGDVYAALRQAQNKRKLLMVEFMASWNSKSTWMSREVLAHPVVAKILNEDFIVVQIDTRTKAGADLARQYEVKDYPCLVVFNDNGNVIDKIDRMMDREDFKTRLEQIELQTRSNNGWYLKQIFAASSDMRTEQANKLAREYLANNVANDIVNQAHWELFSDTNLNPYACPVFDFILQNKARFVEVFGKSKVDDLMEKSLTDVIMPMIIGSRTYDSLVLRDVSRIIQMGDFQHEELLRSYADLANMRHLNDIDNYIRTLATTLALSHEEMEFRLLMTLDFIVPNADKNQRHEALKLLRRSSNERSTTIQLALMDNLKSKLSQ